ncbi:MAG: Dabb family protein [candidate division KSB1 bacterium]|nr:Dabb family protein [candidate division KSB1 bacterium]
MSKFFVHSVYFWLRRDLTPEQIRAFEEGLQSLLNIETVKQAFIGKPAATDRPIIDRTYDYGLIVVFDDAEGHERYQYHPVHDRFRETFSGYWLKVTIYDLI